MIFKQIVYKQTQFDLLFHNNYRYDTEAAKTSIASRERSWQLINNERGAVLYLGNLALCY